MLVCSFVFTSALSEFNLNNKLVGKETRTRASLIVGSDQTYTTIGAAVTAASSGDTIYVHAGTYNEVVVLGKTLSLIGNGSADTIIDSLSSNGPLEIAANYCNVSGFTLKGSGSGATDAGLLIDSDFNHIWECNCSDNQGNGIRFESTENNNTIEKCIVTNNNRNGIRIQASFNNLVKGCTISKNQENGIHLQNTQGNVLENNTISDSIGAGKSSISISSVKENTIKFNYLQNDEHGIAVAMGDDNLIIGNTIVNTDSYAIDLGGACDNNVIYHNNFIDCNKSGAQASDGGSWTIWHNGYPSGGNYWSDWTTPDTQSGQNQDQAGGDGIVDSMYSIDGGKDDTYPLTNPFVVLTIITTDNPTASEDILYSVAYEAWTNMFGSTLSWYLNTNASWLDITGNTIHGTPANSDVGSHWVNISVSDGTNQDSHNFTLTVENANDPPEINTADVLTVNETELYTVDYEATDIDPTNDILTWGVDTNATFLSMDYGTGVLSGTPSRNDLGSYFINVTVNDGHDGWDNSNFTLRVLNLNDPPVIITTDVPTVKENQLYSVDYEANDIDPTNDILTWGVDTNATFLSMNSGTGVLAGTPNNDDRGSYFVNVSVNDGKGGWDHSNFTLIVHNINEIPAINNSWPDVSFDEDTIDESISLNDWFKDNDGDDLTFNFSGNHKLTVTILESGIVQLVPEANWSGEEILTFYANDSLVQSNDSINVTVLPVNDAPFDASIELSQANLTEGGDQIVIGDASDVDIPYGDTLTFKWSSNVTGYSDIGKEVNLALEAGFYKIILNVSDSAGDWILTTKSIEILPPQKVIITNQSDTDSDNLPDDWETEHFDNLTKDGDDDPDNDKFTNKQEWENNTDPNDPNDYPGKVDETPDDEDLDDDSTFMEDFWWVFPLLFLIIILLIIFALIATRKKKEKEEVEEEETETKEETFECPECGAALGADDSFCSECGSTFDGEEVEFECPECGTTIEAGITVCPQCSAEFEGTEEEQVEGEEGLGEGTEMDDEEFDEEFEEEESEEDSEEGSEDDEKEPDDDELERELEDEFGETEEPFDDQEPVTEELPIQDEEPMEEIEPIEKE